MYKILIQTPNEAKNDEWLTCEIISFYSSEPYSSATITIKGIVKSKNVSTPVIIKELNKLMNKEVVKSIHGHFRIKIEDESTINHLKQLINEG